MISIYNHLFSDIFKTCFINCGIAHHESVSVSVAQSMRMRRGERYEQHYLSLVSTFGCAQTPLGQLCPRRLWCVPAQDIVKYFSSLKSGKNNHLSIQFHLYRMSFKNRRTIIVGKLFLGENCTEAGFAHLRRNVFKK